MISTDQGIEDIVRLGTNPPIEIGQRNSIGRKGQMSKGKESKPPSVVRVQPEPQAEQPQHVCRRPSIVGPTEEGL